MLHLLSPLGVLPTCLIQLLIVLARLADEVLPSPAQRLRTVDIDLDVALDALYADDLVMDGAERGKNEVDVP
ncbi:MAG TPA: hypothetical protein VNO30_28400 [Kofleriaceae bacterium]|nr:hypothetical protein [Kofleriaceae bacterium]